MNYVGQVEIWVDGSKRHTIAHPDRFTPDPEELALDWAPPGRLIKIVDRAGKRSTSKTFRVGSLGGQRTVTRVVAKSLSRSKRDPKRPGFYVQAPLSPYHEDITSQARWALGLGRETRYPENLETLHATLPSGMKVRLLRKPARSSRGAHRTSDRLQAYCEYCGKWFGTGNIDQHQIVHGVGSERQLQRYEHLKSRGYPASLKRHRESEAQMKTWKVYWAPEGRVIATVVAKDARAAIRKAPQPYRKYLGEMYAEEV